jgi:hypothetical protein
LVFTGSAVFAQQNQMQQKNQMQMQQQQQVNIDVSDAELEKFASAAQMVKQENQKADMEMQKAIQDEGLSVQKFQQIARSQQNPNAETNATENDMQSFEAVNKQLQKIQAETRDKIETQIQEEGLTLQRYQKILMAIQQDRELQQRLQEEMGMGQQQRQMPQGGGR